MNKNTHRDSLKEGGFILAHSCGGFQSVVMGKAWWRGLVCCNGESKAAAVDATVDQEAENGWNWGLA